MRKWILLLALSNLNHYAKGQTTTEINQWIAQHPKVHLMSEGNYQKLSEEHRKQFKDHILVYQEHITLDQLMKYDELEKSSNAIAVTSKDSDASEIKEWLGLHPGVKVVTQSQFTAMTPQRQSIYEQAHSLILAGEVITVQDIRNYHY